MRSTRRFCALLGFMALALGAFRAEASLVIGGDVFTFGGGLVFENVDAIGLLIHTDGYGQSAGIFDEIPQLPGPPLNLSSTLSSASGTSNAQIGLNVSGGGTTTLEILASPAAISLDQTDLSGGLNDPATLLLILAVPFEYLSTNPTETVFYDFDFDVTSTLAFLGPNDSFLLTACIVAGQSAAGLTNTCANLGGTEVPWTRRVRSERPGRNASSEMAT